MSFLIDQLSARKIAELYSPHYPYQAIVDSRGLVRLPRSEFYCSTQKNEQLVMISGDCQPQSNYGQYEVASKIVEYAATLRASRIISIGGFVSPPEDRDLVIGVATKKELVAEMVSAGANIEKTGIPIVGVAGLVVALAKMRNLDAACILGQTTGLGPDPAATRRVLEVLAKILDLKLDLAHLTKQIARIRSVETKVEEIERKLTNVVRKDQTIYIG